MLRLSRVLLRHRLLVGLFWLAVMVAGMALVGTVEQRLSLDFAVPGAESYEVNQAVLATYGNGGSDYPAVAVLTLPEGVTVDSPGAREAIDGAFGALAADPQLRVISPANTDDGRFVSADGRTAFGLVYTPYLPPLQTSTLGPTITEALRPALPVGTTVQVTGLRELIPGGAPQEDTGVLTETLLGGFGALAVLAFVFGSLLALVPLLIAAVAILTTFLLILGLTTLTDVNFIAQYLVALIGLGVAIDYSLLLVTRWREELANGHTGDEAVQRAVSTAGRAVVLSGLTVAVSLLSLVALPVPFMRSMGYVGLLIPSISVLVTLTLLPVLLASVGARMDWPRLRTETHASPGWSAVARSVVRHRWLAVVVALGILVALMIPALDVQMGAPTARALASAGPAAEGLRELERADIPIGVLTPIEVLVPRGTDPAVVAERLGQVEGVYAATAPAGPSWRRDGTALAAVLPAAETSTSDGERTLQAVRDTVAAELPGVGVGGPGANLVDETSAFYGRFPLMLAVIALITFVLLARAFRSLLLAAKAIALNVISVGATYGVLVLVWQRGYGSQLIGGVPATGAIANWIPLITFAFLFGLSMDYEVFILARMREAYDRTGSTTTAIVEGIGRTGRLVTSAALILFFAFASLASAPGTDIKVAATGLGAGILLDATVVRGLLLPASVSLFGRWNWWLPSWAARVLRVTPSSPAYSLQESA